MAAFHQQLFFFPPAGLSLDCREGSNTASEDKLLTLISLSASIHAALFHLCVFTLELFPASQTKVNLTAPLYQTLSCEKRLKLRQKGWIWES